MKENLEDRKQAEIAKFGYYHPDPVGDPTRIAFPSLRERKLARCHLPPRVEEASSGDPSLDRLIKVRQRLSADKVQLEGELKTVAERVLSQIISGNYIAQTEHFARNFHDLQWLTFVSDIVERELSRRQAPGQAPAERRKKVDSSNKVGEK